MRKGKLQKWQEVGELDNVVEYTDFIDPDWKPRAEVRPDPVSKAEGSDESGRAFPAEASGRREPAGGWREFNLKYLSESNGQPLLKHPAGSWKEWFGNERPIVLELACGRGEYTLGLAKIRPDLNFVGVDIKGARIWSGAVQAKDESLENVRFFRAFIDHIGRYFEKESIEEIWITFPDPFLRKSRAHKRLTSPRFLERYRRILRPGGSIHLKTDSDLLFNYTLETLQAGEGRLLRRIDDVWREAPVEDILAIRTGFERSHLAKGKTIRYLKFNVSGHSLPPDLDLSSAPARNRFPQNSGG